MSHRFILLLLVSVTFVNCSGDDVDSSSDEITICNPPLSMEIEVINDSSVQISWESLSDTIKLEYGIGLFDPGTGYVLELSNINSITIDNLDSETRYFFYISNICESNSESEIIGNAAWVAETCDLKPTITAVFPEFNHSSDVLIYWNTELYNSLTTYIIAEYGVPGFELGTGEISNEQLFMNLGLDLNNLETNTTYEVYIRAKCAEGYLSPYSDPVLFTTEE